MEHPQFVDVVMEMTYPALVPDGTPFMYRLVAVKESIPARCLVMDCHLEFKYVNSIAYSRIARKPWTSGPCQPPTSSS